jgi:hypothetical protein
MSENTVKIELFDRIIVNGEELDYSVSLREGIVRLSRRMTIAQTEVAGEEIARAFIHNALYGPEPESMNLGNVLPFVDYDDKAA